MEQVASLPGMNGCGALCADADEKLGVSGEVLGALRAVVSQALAAGLREHEDRMKDLLRAELARLGPPPPPAPAPPTKRSVFGGRLGSISGEPGLRTAAAGEAAEPLSVVRRLPLPSLPMSRPRASAISMVSQVSDKTSTTNPDNGAHARLPGEIVRALRGGSIWSGPPVSGFGTGEPLAHVESESFRKGSLQDEEGERGGAGKTASVMAEDRRRAKTRHLAVALDGEDVPFMGLESYGLEESRYQLKWLFFLTMHRRFEVAVACMIFANAVVIGLQEDWSVKHAGDDLPTSFHVLEYIFATLFTLELVIHMLAEGPNYLKMRNRNFWWNVFDLLVVASAWVEDFISLGSDVQSSKDNAQSSLGAIRLVRLARILRVVRAMRFFRELRNMVEGIFFSLKPLIWCLILLVLVMFTFGVCILQVAGQMLADKSTDPALASTLRHRFGGITTAVYTLFISISGGLTWCEAAELLMEFHPVMGVLYCTYVAFAVFCVLNIVTGVFVENANSITRSHADNMVMEEMSLQQQRMEDMTAIFYQALQDNAADELSEKEFVSFARNNVVQAYFRKLGLNVEKENGKALFRLIDSDGNGAITLQEFVDGCLQFVGSARQLDIVRMRRDMHNVKRSVEHLIQTLASGNGSGGSEGHEGRVRPSSHDMAARRQHRQGNGMMVQPSGDTQRDAGDLD